MKVSGSFDKTAEIKHITLTPDSVAAWLRQHPNFLQENPEVLTFLTPPEFKRGDRVLDMQRFMLDKVQEQITNLRRRERALLQTVEGNAAGQSKIHQAVTAIVEAGDIHALGNIVRTQLSGLLDLEGATLCIEENGALALAGAKAIGIGGISNLLGKKKRILLQANTAGESLVFGEDADRVKSVAYVRIRTGSRSPEMLLALGSGRDDGFDPHQATDLIQFLANILETRLKQCLGPKS
ncbi:MAG: hypothetical protein CFH41_00348 [Alphaproteobacteria bacterium MarineAlpha11_Bin1]|nr:MAG: hypothetical protein CFH41_00348 [Alphaproteobacteria bacterium MarineAlpha11_Bin1]|tara:strand:+ start:309 stop:1022 length:714 start_codon:yes stop_codon:yes gene_type:complete